MKTHTKREIEKTYNMVMDVLRKDPRARDDDKWLILKVMSKLTKIYIPFEDLDKIPAFETITRVRRKIQNDEKKYLPTSESVRKKRRIREQDFREWASS